MLAKFRVSNFKSFNNDFVLDLTETNAYTFNSECIKNGVVNSALVYGHNGVGKSNLALAMFDIIEHLTDRNTNDNEYSIYLNAYNSSKTAIFYYEFLFNTNKVVYEYKKTDHRSLVYERFLINDEEFAFIDRSVDNNAIIKFKGTETLKAEIPSADLSLLKYIKSNSVLEENSDNTVFNDFFCFIEGMLFFRSLQNNLYLGLEVGTKRIMEDIIEKNNVEDFERFLNEAGIECKLKVIDEVDNKNIAFNFGEKSIAFYKVASQGTKSLALFYFWFQRIKEKSKVFFLFIDEFDAFYHHELSALIVKELIRTKVQFILTTHNTSIITNDLLRPDCYFLMNKTSIRSLSKSTSKELREAHNIEKMYKAGSFDVQ